MKLSRLKLSLITGALLGIFCIIGISFRLGFKGNEIFILATWINRVLIGLVVGLAHKNFKFKGTILGFIMSGSFYVATAFKDTPGFFAGIVYGIIINYIATKYSKK